MKRRLLTSQQAASAFRVGVSSIKRWTDHGELESVRTPGGHRRYTLDALHRFAAIHRLPGDRLPPIEPEAELPRPAGETLFEALSRGDESAVRQLMTPRVTSLAQRAAFLDRVVGSALREIGDRWERGELGVDKEHRASRMVEEAVDRLRPSVPAGGPLMLLACPPDEWHDIPLRLVRLMLEWSGWRTELAGANLPWSAAHAAIDRAKPAAVGFSARGGEPFEDGEFATLVSHARRRGATVIVGGWWARGGLPFESDYLRFRSLRGFERWLRARDGELSSSRA